VIGPPPTDPIFTFCKRCGGPLRVTKFDQRMLHVGFTRRQARTLLSALRFAENMELDKLRKFRYRAAIVVFEEWVGKENKYE
jgi:hypothetical protein